jgi:Flp pilus assembly protein TadD
MGSAYKEKGEKNRADENFQKSIDAYKALIEEDKKNIELNYDIAMVYDARSDYKLAEQHLGRLIALKPDEANAYNYLGYILVEQNKELELAVSYVQKAIEMEPNNGAFHDSLGWAYYKLEKLDEAITELEKAAELTPGDSDIHEHLGDAYSKKGGEFTQKAVQEWEKSLELKPWKTSLKQKLNKFQASLNSNSGK